MGKSKSKLATAYRSAVHSSMSMMLKSVSVIGMLMLFSFSAKAVELGAQAPDFKLQTLSGQEFQLSDYQGKKPVYLVFWATWCPICKAEVPNFKKLHAQLGDKVEILAINVGFQDTLEKAKAYTAEQELPYAVAFDKDTVITKNYGVIGTPWQVVIDINGKVRYFSNHTPENFESHLEDLTKKI